MSIKRRIFALCIQPVLTQSFEIYSYKLSGIRVKSGEVTFIQKGDSILGGAANVEFTIRVVDGKQDPHWITYARPSRSSSRLNEAISDTR